MSAYFQPIFVDGLVVLSLLDCPWCDCSSSKEISKVFRGDCIWCLFFFLHICHCITQVRKGNLKKNIRIHFGLVLNWSQFDSVLTVLLLFRKKLFLYRFFYFYMSRLPTCDSRKKIVAIEIHLHLPVCSVDLFEFCFFFGDSWVFLLVENVTNSRKSFDS